GGQNGDAGRLHRSKTRRTGNIVRQTEKRQSGTRIAAECAKDAGANAAQSRAATIRSASSFRGEFMYEPASIVPRVVTGGAGTDRTASEFPAKSAGNSWQSCQSPGFSVGTSP